MIFNILMLQLQLMIKSLNEEVFLSVLLLNPYSQSPCEPEIRSGLHPVLKGQPSYQSGAASSLFSLSLQSKARGLHHLFRVSNVMSQDETQRRHPTLAPLHDSRRWVLSNHAGLCHFALYSMHPVEGLANLTLTLTGGPVWKWFFCTPHSAWFLVKEWVVILEVIHFIRVDVVCLLCQYWLERYCAIVSHIFRTMRFTCE